jgi:hypothetical protein
MMAVDGMNARARKNARGIVVVLTHTVGLVVLAAVGAGSAQADPLYDMASGSLIDGRGDYRGPEPIGVEVPAIIDAEPGFVRVARNATNPDATERDPCPPPPGSFNPPHSYETSQPLAPDVPYFRELRDADTNGDGNGGDIHLGLSLATAVRPSRPTAPRCNTDIVRQAKAMREADVEGFYDYILLDFALHRPTDKLQRLVDRVSSPAGGNWQHVLLNDSPFDLDDPNVARPARGVWGQSKKFDILSGKDCALPLGSACDWFVRAKAAARGERDALTGEDRRFIDWINTHRGNSQAVLKLEVTRHSARFALLPLWAQCGLLSEWASAQSEEQFKMIYPLFINGNEEKMDPPYSSLYRGTQGVSPSCAGAQEGQAYQGSTFTFDHQKSLISAYDDPGSK